MDHDRFDALIRIAEFRRNLRDRRTALEWTVSLGIWTALGTASFYLRSSSSLLVLFAGVVASGLHIRWVSWNFDRSNSDAIMMFSAFDAAKEEADYAEAPFKVMHPRRFLEHSPCQFQLMITLALAFGALLVRASN